MKFNTAKAKLDGNNPIRKAVYDRVMELIPLGIADIWMINDWKDAEFYLVTDLELIGNDGTLQHYQPDCSRRMVQSISHSGSQI